MKKRFLTVFLIFCSFSIMLFTGCQQKDQGEGATLTFLFYSPELQSQYSDMAAAYKAETGVTLDIQVIQTDYSAVLSSRINSGDIPDVFMSSAYADNTTYRDYVYDLSGEDFIKNISSSALEGVTVDGKILGYPFLVQCHSFIYNKAVFRNAGITTLPRTLAEYDAAAQKIQAAGIQPFATGYQEWWVLPQTAWQALAPAVAQNYGGYANFVSRLNSGSLKFSDVPEMNNIFDLLDLIKKYGGPKPNESDFNDQTSMLAIGNVAMIHQGNWAEDSIKQINPSVGIGFLAGPVGNNASGAGIMFDSNQTIRISKNSKNLQAVLTWLRWLTTSDYGKNWIPAKIKQLSPISEAAAPDSQIAEEAVTMMNNGIPGYPWFYQMFPSGTEEQLGVILQGYCADLTDRKATLAALDDAYFKLAKAAQ
jgi:raffinose/stachyose/melibiose transport system substrate-binding protein